MKKSFVAVLSVLFLSACAIPQKYAWVCPGKTEEEKTRAVKECNYESTKATGLSQNTGMGEMMFTPTALLGANLMKADAILRQCMDLKGCAWEKVEAVK